MKTKGNGQSESSISDRQARQKRYRRGLWAERAVCVVLLAKGYRLIAQRARTPFGEIDLIAVRGQRISFIEVKARRSMAAAEASVSNKQRQRIKRAATSWLNDKPQFHEHEITFDLIFVLPWRLPHHIVNGL
ncbi:MAG: YraN family protein [Pseudomonadota bacterium]